MEARLAWIALNLARGVDRVLLHTIVEEKLDIGASFEDAGLFARLAGRAGVGPESLLESAEKELEKAEAFGATIVTLEDPPYPPELLQIYDPPLALYCLGKLPSGGGLAIVGSRSATHYGIAIARALSREVAARGVAVVSGFARGVDTAAHLAALEAGGATVAVIGSGLNCPYPRENHQLIPKIARGGCVATEFPFDTKPLPMNFPMRNRIISGLGARGTLVVEAAERSGALITARLASDQGREVYAVPGNITSPLSAGTNRLIQQGARVVCSAADLLSELGLVAAGPNTPAPHPLEGEEAAIYDRLSVDSPVHIDALSTELGMFPSRLLTALLALELKNRVRQLPGKFFLRTL